MPADLRDRASSMVDTNERHKAHRGRIESSRVKARSEGARMARILLIDDSEFAVASARSVAESERCLVEETGGVAIARATARGARRR